MDNSLNKKPWLLSLPVAVAIVIVGIIGAGVFYKIRTLDNVLTVTGSAKKAVTSDEVKWVTTISRSVRLSSLSSGYDQMNKDLSVVKEFLKSKNVADSEIVISPVQMEQNYEYRPNETVNEKEYFLRQVITINSKDIAKITDLSKGFQPVISKGVIFSTQSLEYYYSKLPEERVALLSLALGDAKARAEALAQATGRKVNSLKSASSGVVQVLAPNSVEVADYGAYDTSKIEKEIMITVKASFTLR